MHIMIAIFAAALAAWIFGAVYYGTLGRVWQAALDMVPGSAQTKPPIAAMAASFLSELVIAWAMTEIFFFGHDPGWRAGAVDGFLIGFAFMATASLVNHMYQRRRLLVIAIDGIHWIVVGVIEGAVLAALL